MDWIDDLKNKFKDDEEVNKLRSKKFYGYVQVNFFNGNVVDINKYQTRKPIIKQ